MGNEQSKKARASSSSSSTGSKSAKNPLSVLKSGPSNSKIQSHLANAQKSRVLQLRDCGIKTLPDAIDEVAGILRNLDLSQNKIISIPARVGQFASLKQLNFSHNRLEELPDEIGCLKTLETLDVSNNRLTRLPDSLAGCSSLKILNASNNAISVFPTSVCHAFQIEHLDFSCNEITSLPDEIAHLTAVELNLNRNRLSSLNESLADCKNLRVFRVEENCLEKKAFSKKILGSSSISLITYSGNLFQDTEFQDLPGYDQYQVHRMPFDSRKRKTDLSLLSTDTPTTSKQRLHETRHPDIKQGTTEESPSKSNETVRSRLRSSADYKFVPELTADLAVLPKPCTNLIRGPTVISIYALRPQSVRFETNLPRRKLQPSSESSDRKSRSSIVVEKYEENEQSKVHDEQRTLKRETIGEYSKLDALQLSHHSKRDPFSPEARTPSPNLLNITTPATNVPAKRGRGRPRKSTVVRTSSVPQDKKPKRPSSSFVTPRRTLLPSSRRISHLHLRDDHFGSASKSAKGTVRLLEPENLFRNQSDYHSCIVCKEQTLLPTAEFERSIRKGETKAAEPGPDEMTLAEDPAMFCVKCKKCFHLTCVYDEILLQNWATENPTNFVCQQCIRCSKCSDPIFDPGNVQCVTCGKAFHETCKPSTQMIHDFPSISRVWYCQVCEKHIMEILDHKESVPPPTEEEKKPSTSKLVYKTKERPTVKKEKKVEEQPQVLIRDPKTGRFSCIGGKTTLGQSGSSKLLSSLSIRMQTNHKVRKHRTSGPERVTSSVKFAKTPPSSPRSTRTSPTKTDSLPRSPRSKEPTDEDEEAQRLAFLAKLKDGLRYKGEFRCIAARESKFSRLNEEYVNEETDVTTTEVQHFFPFASVGIKTEKEEPNNYKFNFGDIVYKPRYFDFLRSRFSSFHRLSFCQKCLMAFESKDHLIVHMDCCTMNNPPGMAIYQEGNLIVWEVSGQKQKIYSRRLSLFAKTFIGSKTVFYEVEQFIFYILTETVNNTTTLAGYFSKEIKPTGNNNLSCLLILPWMQRKGYGVFLIDMSYQLSLRERKIGSPEHPLSDAGLKTYRQYWYAAIMSYVREKLYNNEKLDLIDIKEHTGIEMKDLIETMIVADMTFILDDKLQVNVETPFYTMLSALRRRYVKPRLLKLNTQALIGSPFTSYN